MPRKIFNDEEDSDFETDLGTLNEKTSRAENVESSDTESEKEDEDLIQNESESDDDDDDDAPDDISFLSGRQAALSTIKSAMQQIHQEKQHSKERRRKQDEQYKIQKKEKLATLAKRKLPADLLASVEKSRQEDIKERKKRKKSPVVDTQHSNMAHGTDERLEFSDSCEETVEEEGDFIPLGKNVSGFQVTSVEEVSKAKALSEDARTFRQRTLYGSRIPRESVKKLMAKTAKKQARSRR